MRFRICSLATLAFAFHLAAAHGESPVSPAAGEVRIVANDMCCKGCAQKIAGQLYTVKGVKSVGVDLPTHTVTVSLGQQDLATLGALWHAAHKANGGPTQLATETVSYTLVLPKTAEEVEHYRKMGTSQHVVVQGLDSQETAQKIASKLYDIEGVSKISLDMQRSALVLQTKNDKPISAWLVVDAVAKTQHRTSAVTGSFGTLTIEYAESSAHEDQRAVLPKKGAVQR